MDIKNILDFHTLLSRNKYITIVNIKLVVVIFPYLKWETVPLHYVISVLVSMATPSLPCVGNHRLTALEGLGKYVIECSHGSFRRLRSRFPDSGLTHCQPRSECQSEKEKVGLRAPIPASFNHTRLPGTILNH